MALNERLRGLKCISNLDWLTGLFYLAEPQHRVDFFVARDALLQLQDLHCWT
jgi:hypothetical protein